MEQFWPLVEEAMQAFNPFYREAMQQAIQESGAPETWWALILVRGSDPRPFTVEHFQALSPYSAPERLSAILEELAALELLERVAPDTYRLTGPGRKAIQGIFDAAHRSMAPLEPLPADEMARLNSMLARLVEASLVAPEPEDRWSIAYSRWTDPGVGAPEAVRTDQYLTDLLRFRDDAHIAAWQPYGVDGHAWEALTFIWREQAHTAEELVEKLPFRLYSTEDYGVALGDLATRGWLVEESGTYRLTEEGRQVREEAEQATDRLYFGPWSCLNDVEQADLHGLLTRMRDRLNEMAESQ